MPPTFLEGGRQDEDATPRRVREEDMQAWSGAPEANAFCIEGLWKNGGQEAFYRLK